MDLKEEQILGERVVGHWYYRTKASAMVRALGPLEGSTALDVGAGSGYFARQLAAATSISRVDCVDTAYCRDSAEWLADGTVLRRRRHLADAAADADVVLLMDVLEHVEDDTGLLAAAAGRLRPGGRVLVTVPAFQWLWSGHDVFLGHHRRYNLPQVEALLGQAGLDVERAHYLFGPVLPAAVAQRALAALRRRTGPARSALVEHHRLTNWLLHRCTMAELPFQRWNRLAGLSVLAVGVRP